LISNIQEVNMKYFFYEFTPQQIENYWLQKSYKNRITDILPQEISNDKKKIQTMIQVEYHQHLFWTITTGSGSF
jgi:hypothetical protein